MQENFKKVLRCTSASVLVLLGFLNAAGQKTMVSVGTKFSQSTLEPYPCEHNISTLNAAHHEAGDNGLVIIIARLGSGEITKGLNRRRLYNARAFLTEFVGHPPQTVITAEGEPVEGFGRVELYVGGKLFETLAIKPNRDLYVGTCHSDYRDPRKADMNLYPFKEKNRR